MSRVKDLRADYQILGRALKSADGSAIAAIARERRLIGAVLEILEKTEDGALVDELAVKRTRSESGRPPARRRQSG